MYCNTPGVVSAFRRCFQSGDPPWSDGRPGQPTTEQAPPSLPQTPPTLRQRAETERLRDLQTVHCSSDCFRNDPEWKLQSQLFQMATPITVTRHKIINMDFTKTKQRNFKGQEVWENIPWSKVKRVTWVFVLLLLLEGTFSRPVMDSSLAFASSHRCPHALANASSRACMAPWNSRVSVRFLRVRLSNWTSWDPASHRSLWNAQTQAHTFHLQRHEASLPINPVRAQTGRVLPLLSPDVYYRYQSQNFIGTHLPRITYIFEVRCLCRANPSHSLFTRYRLTRDTEVSLPQTVRFLNSSFTLQQNLWSKYKTLPDSYFIQHVNQAKDAVINIYWEFANNY